VRQLLRARGTGLRQRDKAQLLPVGAFWSLTMYDADGFQVANPINCFAIRDRDAMKYN
jgi:hypothetical protein